MQETGWTGRCPKAACCDELCTALRLYASIPPYTTNGHVEYFTAVAPGVRVALSPVRAHSHLILGYILGFTGTYRQMWPHLA